MHVWTKILLPKHGTLVQSLTLSLSYGWLTPPPEGTLGPLYDNTTVLKSKDDQSIVPDPGNFRHWPRNISPVNVAQIFEQCSSSVKTLHVTLPSDFQSVNVVEFDYPNSLQTSFIPMVLRLTELRNLYISNARAYHFDDKCLNLIVTNLPLLEGLVWDGVERSDDDESTLLGENLSKLQHLSRLGITHSDVIDESWHYCGRPPKLTDLRISQCDHISSVAEAHWVISEFAPNLQRLSLDLWDDEEDNDDIQGIQDTPENDANLKFDLPSLKTLILGHSNLLLRFVECKSIRSLAMISLVPHGWPVITDLVCTSTWPQLNRLDFEWAGDYDHADWDIVTSQLCLQRKCSESGIKLIMPGRFNF